MTTTGYTPTKDPIFYILVAIYAVVTTALPAVIGAVRFMPVLQTVGLSVFLALAIRRRATKNALSIMALWIAMQLGTLILLTWLLVDRVEAAIPSGFAARGAILDWFYSGAPFPDSLAAQPGARLLEAAGVIVGALLTAGVVGNWFLVQAVNLVGFQAGVLLGVANGAHTLFFALPIWSLLRLAGLAGLAIICAEPLLTNRWSPASVWHTHRRLVLWSFGLLAAGVLLEVILAQPWRSWALAL